MSQTNNENILNDIQSLQKIEQDLITTLETNTGLTTEQQQKTLEKINQISQMRINLYETLGQISGIYKNALENSEGTLNEQTSVIDNVENQLNQAKNRLKLLETEKNNKVRLIEINDYYGQKYGEHSSLMKYIIFMLIPIIIITFLFNKGLLPNIVYYILLFIIAVIGSVFIVYRLLSIWSRDNMNYQEYTWSFNTKDAPSVANNGSNDPWSTNLPIGTCIGDNCCSPGMTFDISTNQCVASCSSKDDNTNQNTNSNSYMESFVNNVLIKGTGLYKKPDVTLNNVILPSNFGV